MGFFKNINNISSYKLSEIKDVDIKDDVFHLIDDLSLNHVDNTCYTCLRKYAHEEYPFLGKEDFSKLPRAYTCDNNCIFHELRKIKSYDGLITHICPRCEKDMFYVSLESVSTLPKDWAL